MKTPVCKTNTNAERARRKHIEFIKYCWMRKDPFIIGKHTIGICNAIDQAINDFKNGISSFLIITVPFRHGKSDIISRYLPARFLGLFKDLEIIVATYAADLSHNLSRFARTLFKSDKFLDVFPNRLLNPESSSVGHWEDYDGLGSATYIGIGGAATGLGYSLGIIDDYCKNREEAESLTIRNKTWEWFTDVFMTRAAPVSITIILATPWHQDDLSGRCKNKMKEDPLFPQFKILKYPAVNENGDYLFTERFKPEWYERMKTVLGSYGTASLLQCEPIARGGNMLQVDRVKIINEEDLVTDINWIRAWDLASTNEERIKSDPDYTAGAYVGIKYKFDEITRENIPIVYLKNIKRIRKEAPERNRIINQIADMDGDLIDIAVECVAGYKDTYTILEEIFKGRRNIIPVIPTKDKIIRATFLEPIIEAGNFYIVRGEWNAEFLDELASFPNGSHDDQIDAVITGLEVIKNNMPYDIGRIEAVKKE